jgi:ketosteroid isomerase-like protein
MKSVCTLFLLILALNIQGQSNTKAESDSNQILQVSNEWSTAIIRRDSLTLEKVMTPDFTLNGSLPRAVWMKNTLHHLKTDELKMVSEPKITIFDDMAVCEAVWTFKATFNESKKVDGKFLITDLWKKKDGKWLIFMRLSKEN